jgi:hypothetical protein
VEEGVPVAVAIRFGVSVGPPIRPILTIKVKKILMSLSMSFCQSINSILCFAVGLNLAVYGSACDWMLDYH